MLNELFIPYRTVDFSPDSEYADSEEYRQINLTGKIPSLKIDGIYLSESAAILLYLSERSGDESFNPAPGSKVRARLYQWCFYAMAELDAHTLYVINKHGGPLKKKFGESAIAVHTAKEGFEMQITKVEKELNDGREFILGDNFSAADILLGTCVESARRIKQYAELNIPHVCLSYWENLKKREGFIKADKRNNP